MLHRPTWEVVAHLLGGELICVAPAQLPLRGASIALALVPLNEGDGLGAVLPRRLLGGLRTPRRHPDQQSGTANKRSCERNGRSYDKWLHERRNAVIQRPGSDSARLHTRSKRRPTLTTRSTLSLWGGRRVPPSKARVSIGANTTSANGCTPRPPMSAPTLKHFTNQALTMPRGEACRQNMRTLWEPNTRAKIWPKIARNCAKI